jgi:hypothetical protein
LLKKELLKVKSALALNQNSEGKDKAIYRVAGKGNRNDFKK